MSWQLILIFVAMLAPVPLALSIRVNDKADPDPHTVRRARYAATLFPVAVVIVYTLVYALLDPVSKSLAAGSQQANAVPKIGLALWLPMAWLFLANLIYVARKTRVDSSSTSTERSASLEPRHRGSPVGNRAWLSIAAALGVMTLAILMAPANPPASSWMLLLSAALILSIGPWFAGQIQISAEPGIPDTPAPVRALYRHRRQTRSWWVFAVVTGLVANKAILSVLLAYDAGIAALLLVSSMALALIVFGSAIFHAAERRDSRQIRELTGRAQAIGKGTR